MVFLILIAFGSFCVGVRGRVLLGRMPESPDAGHCGELTAPWTDTQVTSLSADCSRVYRLKVLPMSKDGPHRVVFPEQPLFRFIRRVYRCCQMGHHCGGVKGLQGRQTTGSGVEFVLSDDVWAVPIQRAEVHLHISNPNRLNVQPLVPWLEKRHLPTKYSVWWKDGVLEVRVDLLFLFQALQAVKRKRGGSSVMEIQRVGGLHTVRAWEERPTEVRGGDRRVEHPLQVPMELGLALHCSLVGLNTPLLCESNGVQLLHTPFITLSYG